MTSETNAPVPPSRLRPGQAIAAGLLAVGMVGAVVGGVLVTTPQRAVPNAPLAQEAVPVPEETEAATGPDGPDGTAGPAPTPSVEPSVSISPTPTASPRATPVPSPATPAPSARPSASTARPTSGTPRPSASARPSGGPAHRVDPVWVSRIASATGVPSRALEAYASATLQLRAEQPTCGIGWNTIAAIGAVESNHGSFGASKLGADGVSRPPIVGVPLNGLGVAAIRDSDGGRLDGDTTWDRAVGPMQFIPGTWARAGSDGNGDGVKDPQNMDDAALAAARYLCSSGAMTTPDGWRGALWSYNRSDAYMMKVAETANRYAQLAPR